MVRTGSCLRFGADRHALSVNGRFSNIRDDDLILVGERYGLGNARSIVEEIKSVLLD